MKPPAKESKPRELRPEQAAAAHTLDRHVSVTAGPGAGKTTVLVERYLEILRTQKVSVENVVGITFTNRAANEMRERVRQQIDKLLHASSGDERQRWLRHKRALESAVITTIHGFCSRLLHEFPVEANIDPQFILLNEHQAAMMLDAVVEETLTETIQHGNEKVVQLAQGVGRGALADALANLYLKYRGEGLAIAEVEQRTAASHAHEREYFEALKELDARVGDLLSARLSKGAEEKRNRAAREWPALRAILAQPPNEQTIARYCQAIEDFRELRLSKNMSSAVPLVDELLWGTKSTGEDCLRGKVPALGFDLLAKGYSIALLKVLREIDRRLEIEKQRLSVLDFDDLQLRTLKLLNEHPEALIRVTQRYRYFLVDEFQDTNGLQRELMKKLGLVRGTNLFIVGDRKQSIYGFRGADVDVFREMTDAILAEGGVPQPLQRNFRSQKPLIDSFNFLFERIFRPRAGIPPSELAELGYVEHEPGEAERGTDHTPPLVELLVGVVPDGRKFTDDSESVDDEDDGAQLGVRERDAAQLVERVHGLIKDGCEYRDIAILFRALTGSWTYESALRRAGIPYLTVQGKGFYQREEITDLIQLLRLLDNTTDELALAAVLRSPLCGISDNALFALRCAPEIGESRNAERLQRRNLLRALRQHREIAFIEEGEHEQLDRAAAFIDSLIQRRSRQRISELLRGAVASSEFMTVIAANFDGAQRIANVEKLFRLAEQFEKSGQLIRDFVSYVEEFEEVGGRESEGQMDESANVVRLMTIHQSKGLEYPVVIIPDVHREQKPRDTWHLLDRHRGLTVRVPDGRGGTARGALYNKLRMRARWREEFEGMRLLYVAATRAEDRLIFSGAIPQKGLKNLCKTEQEQWLAWLWQALELDEFARSGPISFGDDVQFQLTVDRVPQLISASDGPAVVDEDPGQVIDTTRPFTELFPLLEPVTPERGQTWRRFSVTQLLNFQRCARQYYFDRMLRAPSAEELAVWNDAEAPEPPANLTATLKGAVIHRFCEVFREGDDVADRLRASFEEVRAQRQAELAGRVYDIDNQAAIRELLPLAENYLKSEVFQRVTEAQRISGEVLSGIPQTEPGLWSELRFRLRRDLGILTGTIDKLLITPAANGEGVDVEIIDFKTNRFRSRPEPTSSRTEVAAAAMVNQGGVASASGSPQGQFDFDAVAAVAPVQKSTASFAEEIQTVAHDYELQMQSYALALLELLGSTTLSVSEGPGARRNGLKINNLRATLHFLEPNVEIHISDSLLKHEACATAIDEAMLAIVSREGTLDAALFPPMPASHCRMCNFLDLCPAGREWLRVQKRIQ